jgi:hypothetical protein
MPKGPQGQKRPPDVIGAAVLVGRIATGEAEDNTREIPMKRRFPPRMSSARTSICVWECGASRG